MVSPKHINERRNLPILGKSSRINERRNSTLQFFPNASPNRKRINEKKKTVNYKEQKDKNAQRHSIH